MSVSISAVSRPFLQQITLHDDTVQCSTVPATHGQASQGYKTMRRARREISGDQILDPVTCDRDRDHGGGPHPEIVGGGAGDAQISAGA